MVRELVVLGTSSSVPTRHRNHNGYLLNWDDEGVLFDPGEGTQRQLIRSPSGPGRVTRICITHFHGDHVLGLPGILQRLTHDAAGRSVDVYYPEEGQRHFDAAMESSVWDREGLEVRPHPARPGIVASTRAVTIRAEALSHSTPTLGYRVEEGPVRHFRRTRLDELGIRGEDVGLLEEAGRIEVDGRWVHVDDVSVVQPGNRVAFVMDTRLCDAAFRLAEDVDLLVCEATFLSTEEDLAESYGHLTAAQAARIAAESGARRLLLTHFSQRYPDTAAFVAEARTVFDDVVAAQDLMVVEVPHRRRPPGVTEGRRHASGHRRPSFCEQAGQAPQPCRSCSSSPRWICSHLELWWG